MYALFGGFMAVTLCTLFPSIVFEVMNFIIDGDTGIAAMSWRASLVGLIALLLTGVCYCIDMRSTK